MIAINIFSIIQLILIIFTAFISASYIPNYYKPQRYDSYEYYTRPQRYSNYYPSYVQMYPDDYYYNQDVYPLYYFTPQGSKYDSYHSLPYYYPDTKQYYNYPDAEDQKYQQDIEREQRERSQPIGHEIRYEADNDNDVDDETSAAFLNNLMLQQMYQNNFKDNERYLNYQNDDDPANFFKWNDMPYDRPVEDKDVQELKELPKKIKERKNKQQRKQQRKQTNDRMPIVKEPLETSRRETRGQKEEVMMRPATPVRHLFSDTVLDMLKQQKEKKRSPSVYDKIKQLLQMEKNDENQLEPKPTMMKRIVSNEDSLIKQLSVLKQIHK